MSTICGRAERTLNILLFSPQERIAGTTEIRVCGSRAAHLRSVYGAAPGKRLRAGEIGGDIGEATLLSLDRECATLSFNAREAPPPKRPLTVVLALPRPKMLRRMLRTVAESGAREVHLINARRVEKSFWQSTLLTAEVLEGYLLSGLEQSIDTIIPAISLHRGFRPFAEDHLPELATGRRALLAHPDASVPCPADGAADTLLMIGPEGGFVDFETTLAQRAGLRAVSLGDRILRAETALTAMLGRFLVCA